MCHYQGDAAAVFTTLLWYCSLSCSLASTLDVPRMFSSHSLRPRCEWGCCHGAHWWHMQPGSSACSWGSVCLVGKRVLCQGWPQFIFFSLFPSRVQEEVWGGARLVPGGNCRLLHRGEQEHVHGKDGVGEQLCCCMPQERSPEDGLESELSTENGPFPPENTLLPRPASRVPASCTAPAKWFIRTCVRLEVCAWELMN